MGGIKLGLIAVNRFGEAVESAEITHPEFHVDDHRVARLDQDADGNWWLTQTGGGLTEVHVRARVANSEVGGWDHHRGSAHFCNGAVSGTGLGETQATDNQSVAALVITFDGDEPGEAPSYSYTGYTGGDFAGAGDPYGIGEKYTSQSFHTPSPISADVLGKVRGIEAQLAGQAEDARQPVDESLEAPKPVVDLIPTNEVQSAEAGAKEQAETVAQTIQSPAQHEGNSQVF